MPQRFRRADVLAGLALTGAAVAAATALPNGPASAAPANGDLDALLAQLAPDAGVISAAHARASGIPTGELMNRLIPWAATFADPPISHFIVGAIVEGASGALYAGANLEFPGETLAYTVHAEGAATTNAWLHDETGMVSVAVGGVPCGYCRQFLCEFCEPDGFTIRMRDGHDLSLATALPHAFLPAVLGVRQTAFAARRQLALTVPSSDPVVNAALAAAARSHAPYSGTLGGVALRLRDGALVSGRQAENVAFNPGMPPLQAALIALRLQGRKRDEIDAVALVEVAGRASLRSATRAVLATFSPVALTYATAVTV